MLGVMIITAIFSMFMSNTATSVMMLTIMTPLVARMDSEDPGCRAMVLSIPIAANLGGMGTPIGTPPNAIAFRYFVGEHALSFGGWMLFAIPITVIMIAFSWWLLQKMYPSNGGDLDVHIEGRFERGLKPCIVYITMAMTISLWMFSSVHGMNAYAVAIIPVAVFSLCGIVDKHDLKHISWDVLWLLAGGIAIGSALASSGLAGLLVSMVPFEQFSAVTIILGITVLCMIMATFMSHGHCQPVDAYCHLHVHFCGQSGRVRRTGCTCYCGCPGVFSGNGSANQYTAQCTGLCHRTGGYHGLYQNSPDFKSAGGSVDLCGLDAVGLDGLLLSSWLVT